MKLKPALWSLTVKHSTAVLGRVSQGFAGGVQFVAVVTDTDLKLDWLSRFLQHAGAVEHGTQTELPSPLVLLMERETRRVGKSKVPDQP